MITLRETATRILISGSGGELKLISDHFRFRPPDYWRSPRYQIYVESGGERGWNGFIYPANRQHDGSLVLGRGHKDELIRLLSDEGVETDIEKLLESPFKGITVDDIPDDILPGFEHELDHDQRLCIAALLKHAFGCVRVTVSGGKTALFYSLAAMIRRRHPTARFLYLVPTERLVQQATENGKTYLPEWDITQFGGDKKDNTGKDVVVATVATVTKRFEQLKRDGWLKTFTGLLVDEAHHAASGKTWKEAILSIPAFYRFGASDGLKNERKSDLELGITLRGLLGPERNSVLLMPLIRSSRVAKPYIYLVNVKGWSGRFDDVPHTPKPGTTAWAIIGDDWKKGTYVCPAFDVNEDDEFVERSGWQRLMIDDEEMEVESRWCLLKRAYDEGIIRFKERNELVVQWAKHFSKQGKPTLVIATRTPHVYILQTLLQEAGMEPRVLTGMSSSSERDETFDWLVSTPGSILISPIVKEGVNLPELRAGVIADSIASPDLARQVIGRFIRKKPEGSNYAEVVMFVDRQYKSARHNSIALVRELENVRAYSFYYPCAGPDSIGKLYEATDAR